MNDDQLIMVLREQRGKVPMTTPLEQIVSRSRAVRTRRRVPGVAAALGAVAAVAVAVSVALPASHPSASHLASGRGAHLAAWTVTRQAGGSIQVTFRDLRDAAGLQRVLRADGVPVSVTFPGPQNPACRPYPMPPANQPIRNAILHHRLLNGPLAEVLGLGPRPGVRHSPQDAVIIHLAALPSDAGLALFGQGMDKGEPYDQEVGAPVGLSVGLVEASPQCTGS